MITRSLVFVLALGLSGAPVSGSPPSVEGHVVKVPEGDVVVIRDAKHHRHWVRLIAIDSPQVFQPYSEKSRTNLSQLVMGKKVTVEWAAYQGECEKLGDAKCQRLGKVFFEGEDINLRQLELGFAWHDRRFLDRQSTPDRARYNEAEEKARERKLGLWKGANPQPPWEAKKPRHPASVKKRKSKRKKKMRKP